MLQGKVGLHLDPQQEVVLENQSQYLEAFTVDGVDQLKVLCLNGECGDPRLTGIGKWSLGLILVFL
jgi:hypothetical protein